MKTNDRNQNHPCVAPLLWDGAKMRASQLILILFFLIVPHASFAQSSATSIGFQGALTGAGGQPLANGNYTLTFKFYTNATTLTAVATSNVPNVPVTGGLASTPIPVDAAWFNGETRYLGIALNGGTELSPRVLVTAMPYALNAQGVSQSIITKGPQLTQHRLVLGSEAQGDSSFVMQINNPNTPNATVALTGIHSAGNAFADLYINRGGGTVYTGPRFIVGSDSPGESALDIGIVQTDTEIQAIRTAGSAWGHVIINKNGGNVGIGTDNVEAKLTVNGTARMTVCQITSDRNAKARFTPVNTRDVLTKLAAVPIATWAYTNAPGIRHIGPVAQDFAAAFAVGEDEKHIATVDADGVALAAIQGLNQKLEEQLKKKDDMIHDLEKRLNLIERKLESR